jgi:hypothetical protein
MRPFSITLCASTVAVCACLALGATRAAAAEAAIEDEEYRSTFTVSQCLTTATGAVYPVSIDFKVHVVATTAMSKDRCPARSSRASWVKLTCTTTDDKGATGRLDSGWKRKIGGAITADLTLPFPTVAADCTALHGVTWAATTSRPTNPITRTLRFRAEQP